MSESQGLSWMRHGTICSRVSPKTQSSIGVGTADASQTRTWEFPQKHCRKSTGLQFRSALAGAILGSSRFSMSYIVLYAVFSTSYRGFGWDLGGVDVDRNTSIMLFARKHTKTTTGKKRRLIYPSMSVGDPTLCETSSNAKRQQTIASRSFAVVSCVVEIPLYLLSDLSLT